MDPETTADDVALKLKQLREVVVEVVESLQQQCGTVNPNLIVVRDAYRRLSNAYRQAGM